MPQSYDLDSLGLDSASEPLRLFGQFPELGVLSFGEGEYLIREKEETQTIFIVLRGALVVEQASGATPAILACITAEQDAIAIVGEMAYLGAQARAASVRSCGRTYTLCLEPRHVEAILQGYPALTRIICRQFSQRLQETDKTLRTLQERFALGPVQRMGNPGEVLFAQGAPADRLFQLVAGSIRLEDANGVREVTAEDLPQGFLELRPFLARTPHTATATVGEAAFLVVIDAEHREAIVRCFPEQVLALLGE